MSFLAPLYFLGAAAVAAPILFHLIRRQPKGEVEFSSLMFLEPTPPKLTRRSRLENLPLLLMRCLAILALAFAFARPFFPSVEAKSEVAERKALVLLVDRSASMRRDGVWDRLVARAKEIVDSTESGDLISVVAFDSAPTTELSLAESLELSADDRRGAAIGVVEGLQPSWRTSNIGLGIRYAADLSAALVAPSELETETEAPAAGATVETRIVLLSDLQDGAAIQSLQGYDWPAQVWLDLQSIQPVSQGNASLRVVGSHADAEEAEVATNAYVRVEVGHFDDTGDATFALRFGGVDEDAAVVQVPVGESRFLTLDLPESVQKNRDSGARLTLFGDEASFDNTCYFVPPRQLAQRILIFGENARTGAARERLSFYLRQLPFSNPTRDVTVAAAGDETALEGLSPENVPLVVIAGVPQSDLVEPLQAYLRLGGRAVVVLDKRVDEPGSLSELLDAPDLRVDEAGGAEYALVSSVDFRDRLIAPLSEPGFSDFSNIRIWKHRVLSGLGESARAILKLDDSAPLLLERRFAAQQESDVDGHLWVLSAGWQPEQSQLALSTKFVPLMLGMVGNDMQLGLASAVVGDASEDGVWSEPGIQIDGSGAPLAINLAWTESETSPLEVDRLSEFGARLSSVQSREQDRMVERALRDVELESRQAWWQWLIFATLGVVALETVYSGRNSWNSESAQG